MKEVTYKKKSPEERENRFCRICYRRTGSDSYYLDMNADRGEDALRGIAVMLMEYAKRKGESINEVNYELLKECDRLEKKGEAHG